MFTRGKSALITIVILCLIGILGFKDTGIFIEEFAAAKDNGTTIIFGKSKVNKTIEGQDNTYYVLIKGEIVLVKDFKDDNFIIIDEKEQEFQVPKDYISLRDSKQASSRSGLSRRTLRLNAVIQDAHKALGKPYGSGGIGPDSYDCSGLTYSLYLNSAGIELERVSKDQATNGTPVKKSELIPGDLVFFKTSGPNIGHVGLYIGDGNMIHASSGKAKKVITTSIDDPYWYKPRYATARRIIE